MALTIENSRMEIQCYPMEVTLSDGSTTVPADQYISNMAIGYTATDENGMTAYMDGLVNLTVPGSKDPSSFTAFASLEKSWGDAIAEQWRADNDVDVALAADMERINARPKVVVAPWNA